MYEFGEDYERILRDEVKVSSRQPTVSMISTVTGKRITEDGALNATYWRANLESPVFFCTAVNSFLSLSLPRCVFVEIGPHSALAGPLRQMFKTSAAKPDYVPTLQRNSNCASSLLSAIGRLHCHSVLVDFSGIISIGSVLTNLPAYPWNYAEKFWVESRISESYRMKKFPHHDILGDRVAETDDFSPKWRNILTLENVLWIKDHRIKTDIVFPAAGYVAIVGEAIRQLSGSENYTVRNVTISAAMVFPDMGQLETMTSLNPGFLTVSLNSTWYDFTISSYNGTTWTKHCIGQVQSGRGSEFQGFTEIARLPRTVSSQKWYRTMAKVGLNYGPAFSGLTEISAGVLEHTAVASVVLKPGEGESPYALHPTMLDMCFQLFSVAVAHGQSRDFDQLYLPTYIEELCVTRCNNSSRTSFEVETVSQQGVVTANARATVAGAILFQVNGLTMSLIQDENAFDDNTHAAVRLEWKPDVDFLEEKKLMRVLKDIRSDLLLNEKLCVLCILETSSRLMKIRTGEDYPQTPEHYKKFISWIEIQKVRIENGDYPLVANVQGLSRLDGPARMKLIQEIYEAARVSDIAGTGEALYRVLQNIEDIIRGKVDLLELLLKDDILAKVYDSVSGNWDYQEFFTTLTHSKPHLRILEIGAGTGGTTANILKCLRSHYGERMYAQYTFSDISAGFFVAAKQRFTEFTGMDYAVLDISKDPTLQGFRANSYDLIVASNVIHATPNIHESLVNIHKLLHPGGRLFLQELYPRMKWLNFVMGAFAGWWLGEADDRIEEPYISPERWNDQLQAAGFAELKTVLYDDEPPYQANVNMLARPLQIAKPKNRATLLCGKVGGPSLIHAEAALLSIGYEVDICQFPHTPPPGQDIVSLLELQEPFFSNITAESLSQFLKYMTLLQTMKIGILWLTKPSQINCQDPNYSHVM